MAQQIIDIGTGPGIGDGDPLRVAFSKINQNFTEVYTGNVSVGGNSSSAVTSVAGKVGNVQLTVSDVIGACSQGYALNLVTTAVHTEMNTILDGAPAVLDTLRELADAISNDPNFAAEILTQLTHKFDKAGGTLTGALYLPADPTIDLQAATKQYVDLKVAPKANAADVYTKSQIDQMLLNITNTVANDFGDIVNADNNGSLTSPVTTIEDFGGI